MRNWKSSVVLALAIWIGGSVIASAATTQLTLFSAPQGGRPLWYEGAIEAFEARNPDIDVELVTGWLDKFQTMVAGGAAPDVYYYDAQYLPSLVTQGQLLPLSEFAEKDLDLGIYIPATIEALTWKGELYALPRAIDIVAVRYNGDLFEQRAVKPVDENWTWDDLVAEGKKLTYDTNGDGLPDQWGFMDKWENSLLAPIYVWAAGGEYWNEDYTQSLLNSEEAIRGLQFWWDIYKTYRIGPDFDDPAWKGQPWDYFRNGQVAIFPETRGRISPQQPFKVVVAPMPIGPVRRASGFTLDFVGIQPQTQHKEEAWRLTKFLASREGFAAGREEHRDQAFYSLLSPIAAQAVDQILADGETGGEWWLRMSEMARISPVTHPGDPGLRICCPNWTLVKEGQSIREAANQAVANVEARIQELIARGVTW